MSTFDIPASLTRNVTQTWGAAGREWLVALPRLLAGICESWDLQPAGGGPFAMSYHWVMPVTRPDGSAAVLKVGLPDDGHLAVEAATLGAYAGRGAVRLLAHDPARGAHLLERAEPGTPASSLVPHDDAAALAALLSVRRELHAAPVPSDGVVPDVSRLGRSFDRYLRTYPGDGPLPRRFVATAARLLDELCASAPARVVLHGDLHHDNVLRADDHAGRERWLAIDPHGWVGDPGYDLGTILFNPLEVPDAAVLDLLPGRLERIVADGGQPRERAVAWCFVKAVLSDVWTTEGDGEVDPSSRATEVARRLEPLL
jgi:streptomycin 6-kinase